MKITLSHYSLGQTIAMNVPCHGELSELGRSEFGCTLSCKTDFWQIFLFRLKSHRRFITIATVMGRISCSGVREY